MAKEIRLVLTNEKGQKDTFIQEKVPLEKLVAALEMQDDFEQRKVKTNVEGVTRKIKFVASLFDDERVTPEALLTGLDARDFEETVEAIINIVMGIDPEIKKYQTENP